MLLCENCVKKTLSCKCSHINISAPCNKPDIDDGNVEPDSATINSGINYEVTCNDGFIVSGISSVTCTDGVLSTVPTCQPGKTIIFQRHD